MKDEIACLSEFKKVEVISILVDAHETVADKIHKRLGIKWDSDSISDASGNSTALDSQKCFIDVDMCRNGSTRRWGGHLL